MPMSPSTSAQAPFRRRMALSIGAAMILGTPLSALPARAEVTPAPTPSPTASASPSSTPSATPTPSASATASPSPTSTGTVAATATGRRTLRYGDRGDDVKALQRLLRVSPTGYFGPVTLKAVKRIQRAAGLGSRGVVGPKTYRAIKRWSDRQAAARSLPRAGSPAASRRYARAYIAQRYGWGDAQFSCLSVMWERESNWRYWVSNPNGLYHGIPQTSWREWTRDGYTRRQYMRSPEVQIKVGTRYIKQRYGTPCGAWSFWRSHHWY